MLAAVALLVGLLAASPLPTAAQPARDLSTASVASPATGDRFGDAANLGSMRGSLLAQPVVGIAGTKTGRGYWLVARDGGIFSFGDAAFFGSTGAMRLNQPIVGITSTPTGQGYWFVASDGGVFSFGDAGFFGSTGAIRLNQPIVGMAATPSGKGYWLVASDGGIFAFGDAAYRGSTGGMRLNQPVAGMAPTPSGAGYWLVARDGGVFSFGDARGLGSAAGRAGRAVVGIAPATEGTGYWVGAEDGAVFPFGAAGAFGSGSSASPVVGIAATPSGKGYWLATADGDVLADVAAPIVSGTFGFLRIGKNGRPVRYDPCVDQHYVINPALAPAGAVDEVRAAFDRLGAATGIRFVYDGSTTETHLRAGSGTVRRTYQPERYGDRYAPILVSWTTDALEPLLAGGTLGYGGSTSRWSSASDEAFVTGEVVLDIDESVLVGGPGAGLTRGNLIQHELGHLVGLDHVADRSQLMNPTIHGASPSGYAGGDLTGLRQLGATAGCLSVAPPG